MTSGRKPLPGNLRLLEGNKGHRPIPKGPEPTPGIPDPPKHLHEYAVEEWDRVSPYLYNVGCLTFIDRAALAGYCQAYARWRVAEERFAEVAKLDPASGGILARTKAGNVIQNPLLSTANAALRDMLRFAAEFGMTPSSRARLSDSGERPKDPIAAKFFD